MSSATSETASLEIRMLGPLEVKLDGKVLPRLNSRRALWLLAILGLNDGRPVQRSRLAGMLWPDSPEATALHNLRQTLSDLRRALGPAAPLLANDARRAVRLDSGRARIDVLDFDAAVADGRPLALERAAALYRGPLLEGCDEPWAGEARESRERAYLDVLERLAAFHAGQQDHAAAVAYLRRAIEHDPLRESVHRALMASLAGCGEYAAAVEAYRELRVRLRRELNVEPDPETAALYHRVLRDSVHPPAGADRQQMPPGSVPLPLTTLIGRQDEIREIDALLDRCRLVTLTGVGGVGKTRLAIAVASESRRRFSHGAWFVDLAPLQMGDHVSQTVASVLGVRERPDEPIAATLAKWTETKELLLVLDNCEHLVDACAALAGALLSSSPGARILATSRQPLGVLGEAAWRVPSLSLPPVGDAGPAADSADRYLESAAVRLFVERAGKPLDRIVRTISSAEMGTIANICGRLDGIPLAIELAAARAKAMSPVEMLARLEDAFALLGDGGRSVERHQTLRAAMDWSYRLLSKRLQLTLNRLSAFVGGCSRQAAASVCSGGGIDQVDVPDLLSLLVDRSLLMREDRGGEPGYRLLETVRQFAAGRLRESGEWEETHDRHRDHFLSWAQEVALKLSGAEQTAWFARLENEHDNLRAALHWCRSQGDIEEECLLTVAMARFWDTHGHLAEGRAHLESLLARMDSEVPAAYHASVNGRAGWIAIVQGDWPAARRYLGRALSAYRGLGDRHHVASVLNYLASATGLTGDLAGARPLFDEALSLCRELAERSELMAVHNNLGEVLLTHGEYAEARAHLEESLKIGAGTGDHQLRGITLCNLAHADFRQAHYAEALRRCWAGLRVYRSCGSIVNVPSALYLMAAIEHQLGRLRRSTCLLGASESLCEKNAVRVECLPDFDREGAIRDARRSLGIVESDAAYAEGMRMDAERAIAYALEESTIDGGR